MENVIDVINAKLQSYSPRVANIVLIATSVGKTSRFCRFRFWSPKLGTRRTEADLQTYRNWLRCVGFPKSCKISIMQDLLLLLLLPDCVLWLMQAGPLIVFSGSLSFWVLWKFESNTAENHRWKSQTTQKSLLFANEIFFCLTFPLVFTQFLRTTWKYVEKYPTQFLSL